MKKRIGRSIVFLWSMLFFHSWAWASRSIVIAPVTFTSVHGGALNGGVGPLGCATADMSVYSGLVANAVSGVEIAEQTFTISLTNISNITQTVTMSVLSGTQVDSFNSGGAANQVPNVTGPNQAVTTDTVRSSFTIPAFSTGTYKISFNCSSTTCLIADTFGTILGSMAFSCGTHTPQICLLQSSRLLLKLTVTEDAGALMGGVSSVCHRACGYVDHYVTAPPTFQLNAGKAF